MLALTAAPTTARRFAAPADRSRSAGFAVGARAAVAGNRVGAGHERPVRPAGTCVGPEGTRAGRMAKRPSREVLRRRRTLAAGLAGAVALGAWAGVHAAVVAIGGEHLGASATIAARVVVVQPGDTLWTIAESVDPHGDVRPLVDRLVAETGGRPLRVGERIDIP